MHLTCRCHAAITIAPAKPSIIVPKDLPQHTAIFLPADAAAAPISCLILPHCCAQQGTLPVCRCHASVCPEEPSCCPQCSVAYDTLPLQQQQQLNHRRRKGQRDAQQPDHEAPEAALQRHEQQQHAAGTNGKHREGPLPSAPPTLFDFLDRKLSNSAGAGPDQLPRTQSGGDAAGGHCNSSGPPRLACCADDSNLEQDLQHFAFSPLCMGVCRWVLPLQLDIRGCLLHGWRGTCNALPSTSLYRGRCRCWLQLLLACCHRGWQGTCSTAPPVASGGMLQAWAAPAAGLLQSC